MKKYLSPKPQKLPLKLKKEVNYAFYAEYYGDRIIKYCDNVKR